MRVRSFSLPFSELPDLGQNEVHVWTGLPGELPGPLPDPASVLSEAERSRAERYRHPRARDQFVQVRGLLRLILANYLKILPGAVALTVRADGKPVLAGCHSGAIEFNLSHTDGMALIAIARRLVGIDLERVRVISSAEGLVERFFSPEEREQFRLLPTEVRSLAFLRGWVCKEAVLKGIGCGARELDRCIIDLDPRNPPRIVGPDETLREWRVASWEPSRGYLAALAVQGTGSLQLEVD